MSTQIPTQDIASYLDTNTTQLTLGTNLFYGLVREHSTLLPAKSVFIANVGGRSPSRIMASTGQEIRYEDLQVRVRSTGWSDGEALVKTVYGILQSAKPTNYLDVRSIGNPVFLEQDSNLHYHWSLNFRATYNST